jgi:hypothetical protein
VKWKTLALLQYMKRVAHATTTTTTRNVRVLVLMQTDNEWLSVDLFYSNGNNGKIRRVLSHTMALVTTITAETTKNKTHNISYALTNNVVAGCAKKKRNDKNKNDDDEKNCS